jgi:putative membrane protein
MEPTGVLWIARRDVDMYLDARDRVPELTAILSLVSLALVFGSVLGAIPRGAIPRAPEPVLAAIPHVNAAISALAIVTIAAGVAFARRGAFRNHRAMMLLSAALFAAFLVLYLYKVALEGPAEFPGPETVYRRVYLPLLAIHILLAIVCIPLLYYVILLATTRPISALRDTAHARVGRVAAGLWLVSFVLGNAVYALLYVVY